MKYKTATIALLSILGLGVLGGCGEDNNDASRGTNDTAPADIIAFPDGFSNVAHKCDGPNMIYSATNGSNQADTKSTRAAIAVVANDPRCTAKWKGQVNQ